MKISKIIGDIEYIEPKGMLKNYKYGINQEQLYSKYSVPSNELNSDSQVMHTNPALHELDTAKLKEELSKVRVAPMTEPKPEIIGKE